MLQKRQKGNGSIEISKAWIEVVQGRDGLGWGGGGDHLGDQLIGLGG